MMIALYSINLRIMGRSNVPLLNQKTVFTMIQEWGTKLGLDSAAAKTWGIFVSMAILTLLFKFFMDWFLQTEVGLAIRATGDNPRMIRSLSANTNLLIVLGLGFLMQWLHSQERLLRSTVRLPMLAWESA